MENGPFKDVLPMEHGDIPANYVSLPEGIYLFFANHPTKTDQNHRSSWWFQTFVIFTTIWGRWTHFDEHIFQMGWFNHQLEVLFQNKKRPRLLKVSAIQKTDAVVVMGIKRPIVLCITGIWAIPHEVSRCERMTRWWFQTFTLPETNIAPENGWLKY